MQECLTGGAVLGFTEQGFLKSEKTYDPEFIYYGVTLEG